MGKTLTGPMLPALQLPDYPSAQRDINESRSTMRWVRRGVDTGYPCIVCGTRTGPNPSKYIHVCDGGSIVRDPRDLGPGHGEFGESGCLGFYPIGPSCLKNFPQLRPYASKTAGADG